MVAASDGGSNPSAFGSKSAGNIDGYFALLSGEYLNFEIRFNRRFTSPEQVLT